MGLITDKEMPEQEPLIEAARIRFKGMSKDGLEDPPALDVERTYIVKAICAEHQHKRMKDGEVRLVATMEVLDIWERGKQPIVDEAQPMLFEDAMRLEQEEAAAAAESDEDGPEPDGETATVTAIGGPQIFSEA